MICCAAIAGAGSACVVEVFMNLLRNWNDDRGESEGKCWG